MFFMNCLFLLFWKSIQESPMGRTFPSSTIEIDISTLDMTEIIMSNI